MMRIDRQARSHRADRGSSPVELAILAPAILLALFASIQVAAWFMARSTALAAAQESTTAQRAYLAPGGVGQERATAFLGNSGDWLADPRVTVAEDGQQVTTTVTGKAISLIPGMTLTVTQTARGERERFTTADAP
jgi:Flp pilus assembly protein TadG